jgi:hypothetical protein
MAPTVARQPKAVAAPLHAVVPVSAILYAGLMLVAVFGIERFTPCDDIPWISDGIAGQVLHLNAVRSVGELMAASMERNEARRRAGQERRMLVDPLNPSTWNLEDQADEAAELDAEAKARLSRVTAQIAFVEVEVVVWKWAVVVLAGGVALLGALGLARRGWRRPVLYAVLAVVWAAALATGVGMWGLTRFGGFPPRLPIDYVGVVLVGSAYGWALLVVLGATRPARHRPVESSNGR